MIWFIYGNDRVKARNAIDRQLGKDYEVIDAEELQASDMPSIFLGTSLFGDVRSILIKGLSENKECFEVLPKYVADCSHNIVIWENKLDKRSVVYKELSKNKSIEFKEFKITEEFDSKKVFGVFDAAMRGDGKGALALCEQIETTNDPFMFMGLMTSQAIKKLQFNNPRARKALKVLAETDINMKTTDVEPWSLIKIALLKIAK